MGRRSSLLEDLMELPWPIGAVMALLCYPVALILSGYLANQQNQIVQAWSSAPLQLWPIFAFLFGFASLLSYIIGRKKRNLYKQNQSIQQICNLTWQQFEFYVGQTYREKGYFVVETPEGPDDGVDLILRKDGEKTFVQCKHWKLHRVGVEKVRELLGSMVAGGADHGVFVTTGNYTQPAMSFGAEHGIQMIDGAMLEKLINPAAPTEHVPYPIQSNKETILCPSCEAPMVKRLAQRGQNKGCYFWGCPNFPACKGTRNI